MSRPPEEWQPCFKFFPVRSIHGTELWGEILKRKVNGETKYRDRTDEEAKEWRDRVQGY